jgi:hypothetical protein
MGNVLAAGPQLSAELLVADIDVETLEDRPPR